MIIIKGQDEAAIVARIESELKGEEVDIFQADDTDYTMEQVLAFLGYNAKQARVYIGRIERNTRKVDEDIRATNELLVPISMYFSYLCQESLPESQLTMRMRQDKAQRLRAEMREREREAQLDEIRSREGLKGMLQQQRDTSAKLQSEGKAPE